MSLNKIIKIASQKYFTPDSIISFNYKKYIDEKLEEDIIKKSYLMTKKMYDRQKDKKIGKIENRARKIALGIKSEYIFFRYINEYHKELTDLFEFSGLIKSMFKNGKIDDNYLSDKIDKYDIKIKLNETSVTIDIKSSQENNTKKKYTVNKYGNYIITNQKTGKQYKYKNYKTFLLKNRNYTVLPDQSPKDYTMQVLYDLFGNVYLTGLIADKDIRQKQYLRNLILDNGEKQPTYMRKINEGFSLYAFIQTLKEYMNTKKY